MVMDDDSLVKGLMTGDNDPKWLMVDDDQSLDSCKMVYNGLDDNGGNS